MQYQTLRPIAIPVMLLLLAACATCGSASGDFIGDIKNSLTGETKTGMGVKVGGDSASIGVKTDDGNPFYYVECSVGVSINSGFGAGCERKWKPLFYGCVAGGAVLAALLLSCCCCCCCAPCRKKRTTGYYTAMPPNSIVVLQTGAPTGQPVRGDVQMLSA